MVYNAFTYKASTYQKADGIFYHSFKASAFSKTDKEMKLTDSPYANAVPMSITSVINLSPPGLMLDPQDLVNIFKDARASLKAGNPGGLGGSSQGFTVRCVKGDQWEVRK